MPRLLAAPTSVLCGLAILACTSCQQEGKSEVGTTPSSPEAPAKAAPAAEFSAELQPLAPAAATPPLDAPPPVVGLAPPVPLPPLVKVGGRPRFVASEYVMVDSPSSKAPWTRAEVSDAYFYFQPRVGAEVNVLPLCDRQPFRLQVTETRKERIEDVTRWETSFTTIRDAVYLKPTTTAYSCEVVVVYPAQEALALLKPEALKMSWLPSGVTPNHVQLAVDTNSDGKPDALRTSYCTDDRAQPECYEATAHVLYQLSPKGWRKLYTWEPVS